MFESLSERLGSVFDRLTKAGALTEADVVAALREVRVALLEADVSLPVARDFIKRVQDKATGAAVTKSITPGQMVVKFVHDELVRVLAGDGLDYRRAADAQGVYQHLFADVSVPTLGGTVELRVPADSDTGRKLRLRGRGLPGKPAAGDQIVEIEVRAPKATTDAQKALYEQMAGAFDFDPRRA